MSHTSTAAVMNLVEYRQLVEQVMLDARSGRAGLGRVFANSGEAHARVVLDTMVDNAQNELCIYSERMHRAVFDADRIRAFLTRSPNALIRVVLEFDAIGQPDCALTSLQDQIDAGRIEVSVKKLAGVAHVAVVDGQHVRLERDHIARTATVAFGHAALAAASMKLFELLFPDKGKVATGAA